MSSYVARQPIFKQNLNIYGYELLYRNQLTSTEFDSLNGDQASSETIMNSFHKLGVERVTGGKRAFVNFTERLLLDEVATILSSRILIIELLESIKPTTKVLEACKQLKKQDYLIALDDFMLLDPEYQPLLEIADIVKIDFLAYSIDEIHSFALKMKDSDIILLAERLETYEMFEKAKKMNFSLFQGNFFSKPVTMKTDKNITPIKVNYIRLMRLIMDPDVNFTKISEIIKQDVALSYQLLKVVNSAYFGLRYTVNNIRHALAILGMNEIRKWLTLISMSVLKEEKPDELIRISLIRARFLELVASKVNLTSKADDLFLLGMLSLMDAMMDQPLEIIVKETQIAPSIAQPLLTKQGQYGELLQMIINYENCDWDAATKIAKKHNISSEDLIDIYIESIEWTNEIYI